MRGMEKRGVVILLGAFVPLLACSADNRDATGRAADILLDDRLTERLAHSLGDEAADGIDRRARGKRHYH